MQKHLSVTWLPVLWRNHEMTRFAFVTWDGGGNLGPAVGIAQELVSRGHEVRFFGYKTQRARIEDRGFLCTVLRRSGDFDLYHDVAAEQRLAALVRNVWACPEHLADIPEALTEYPADVLVIDFLMQGALAFARQTEVPVAVLAHSAIAGLIPPPESPVGAARLAATNQLRAAAGLPTISRLNEAWDHLLTLVTTIPDLDSAAAGAADTIRYIGPVVERLPSRTWDSPWDAEDSRPMVLVSFTTTRLWDQRGRIQNTLAALSDEPVRVLVSASDAANITPLPANAAARQFVPHELVLPSAALTVTHCGHGTVTASLAHGVPVVGLPNPAADQPYLAARLALLGAGMALDGESGPEAIRTATREILSHPAYTDAARRLADVIQATPRAAGAAAELEHLASAGSSRL
ncbi:MAG: glycosyltransferase [Ktedonobacterales bacterium]